MQSERRRGMWRQAGDIESNEMKLFSNEENVGRRHQPDDIFGESEEEGIDRNGGEMNGG